MRIRAIPVPFGRRQALGREEKASIARAITELTLELTPDLLVQMIHGNHSLYQNYMTDGERGMLRTFFGRHRSVVRRLEMLEVRELVHLARPDLTPVLGYNGGVEWLARQWRELLEVS